MIEDDLFADWENPYQHYQQQLEECWLREMTQKSKQLLESLLASNTIPNVESIQTSRNTLVAAEFEPFQTDRSTQITTEGFLNETSQKAARAAIQGDIQNPQIADSNYFESHLRPNEPRMTQQKQKKGNGVSFNTIDYIIKHCFKKMLSEEYREEVEPICQAHNLQYSVFASFWKQILQRYAPSKHIGLTRFVKFIEDRHPAAMVCRIFFSSYLMQEYPRYITVGNMHNKQEYLRCATKLMYISCPPKMGSKHILSARKL